MVVWFGTIDLYCLEPLYTIQVLPSSYFHITPDDKKFMHKFVMFTNIPAPTESILEVFIDCSHFGLCKVLVSIKVSSHLVWLGVDDLLRLENVCR